MKKENKPYMDILVDKHLKKIQEILVINNTAVGHSEDGDMLVKYVGNGEDWINPHYKNQPGQFKTFATKLWIQFG